MPRRQSDIGIWLQVMRMLGKISVLTTAFISEFSYHIQKEWNNKFFFPIFSCSCIFDKLYSTFSPRQLKGITQNGVFEFYTSIF